MSDLSSVLLATVADAARVALPATDAPTALTPLIIEETTEVKSVAVAKVANAQAKKP